MKKLLLSLFMVVVAMGMTNATEKTVLTNSSASTWTGDAEGYSTTIDGMTISYTKGGSPAVAPSADHIRVYKGATLTVKSANGEAITSIVINCTEKKYCADIIVGGETLTANTTDNTITWTGNVSEFVAKSDIAQIRIKSIVISYGKPAAVATPAFSPNGGTYYEAQNVIISCSTADATIHYTIDGTEPTTASTVYTAPIKVETTTTIKAIASKGNDLSDVASATYNMAVSVDNIAKFYELGKDAAVEFVNPVNVLYQNGIYLFVQDATGALQIYGAVGQTYKNGDVIPAGFQGVVGEFAGALQLGSPVQASFKAGTTGATIAPTIVTAAQVTNDMANRLIKIGNVSVASDGKSITDASGSLNIYSRFTDVTIPQDEKKYDITAIVNLRNGDIQLFPTNFTESQNVGITGTESDNAIATVFAGDKAIKIDAAESAQVLVVNTVGQVVASKIIAAGANTVEVPAGLYLVKVNNAVTKVIIK
ncbi:MULTISPECIES: chitobiase/beta-hexosaminidase C-terminal domain-containing protein [Bacteroides]|uniref:chitobiase/beta-hexosaminidase C-terminal domain-containing protein n=1 Tax=Bacteroides TaxID=816 RepID=UPI00259CFFE6|nr:MULTISPECIES: chitobiase/beta-hexosaminidase C-terminal domain-containing protein [Bacteroides]